jgi:hypothetical protein
MPKPDHRSQMARAWLHFHAARKGRGSGSAAPRVDWPVYPRRAEHNTVAEGGNRRSTIAASSQIRRSPFSLASFSYPTDPSGSVRAIASKASTVMAMLIKRQARRAGDPSQPFLCSLHSGRLRTAGPLASRTLSRPRSGHRREREAHAHRHRAEWPHQPIGNNPARSSA